MSTFVEQLIARLALDTDEQSFKKGERGMDDLAASAVKMGAVIGAAFVAVQGAVVAMVVDYANNAREIENLSRVAGEGFESFQKYAAAAKTVGVEQDKLSDILKDVNDKVGDFMQTGAGPMADFFENIGPKVGITADMFKDLSGKDALQLYVDGLEKASLSQAEMTFYMEAIASDATLLLPLLKNGGAGFSAMAQEALDAGAVISESGAESAKEMNAAFTTLGFWITGIKNDIAEELVPTVTDMINGFKGFIKENKELISGSISTFFRVAAVALKGLVIMAGIFAAIKLGAVMIAAAQGVMILSKAFSVARIAALLMSASALLLPMLIGLGIAALALLAEDLYQFFTGGESLIGDFVKKWPLLGDAINGVADAIKVALGFADDLGGILLSILTLDFGRLMDSFQNLGNRIISVFKNVGQAISDSLPDWAVDALGSAFSAAESVGSAVSGAASSAGAALSGMAPSGGFLGGPIVPTMPLMMPMQAAQAGAGSTTTQEDNRQYHITGTDIGEVKRVINEKNAFAAKVIDTGREY